VIAYDDARRELAEILENRKGTFRAGVEFDSGRESAALIGASADGTELTAEEYAEATRLAQLRASGTPLAHLVGHDTFLGTRYSVEPGLLAPHPATEALAVTALERLAKSGGNRAFEIGHGVGHVAVEIARRAPNVQVVCSDLDPTAHRVAVANAARILGDDAGRVRFVLAESPLDVLEPFRDEAPADLVVTNPPYLSPIDPISDEVRNNTTATALYGPDGDANYFYRALADEGRELLTPNGAVVAEFHEFHRREVRRIFARRSWEFSFLARADTAGFPGAGDMVTMTPTGHRILTARPE
jgi:HemK-like putative methylase